MLARLVDTKQAWELRSLEKAQEAEDKSLNSTGKAQTRCGKHLAQENIDATAKIQATANIS